MSLSLEEVRHVAMLARLGMTEDELVDMQEQLSSILGHIEVLNELNTDDISPTAQVVELTNVMRADEVIERFDQATALANATEHRQGFFAVPAVMGGAEGGSA